MIAKAKCPRCGRSVAVMRREPELTLFRHMDENHEWCSGTPKPVRELVLDLFHSLQAQEAALREYADELIRHTEDVVRLSRKHGAQQRTTTAIIQQITDSLKADAARRRA